MKKHMTETTITDMEKWNERFDCDEYVYGKDPCAFLIERANLFQAGKKVLCIGEGEGRNAVFLATLGLDVTCVDFSRVALEKAENLAAENGVELRTLRVDLNRWVWPKGAFDYVVWVFLHVGQEHRPRLHKNIRNCLKENGMVIGEVFHKNQLDFNSGGPKDESFLYDIDEIENSFLDMKQLLLEERLIQLTEGLGHQGQGVVVDFVLRRQSEFSGGGGRDFIWDLELEDD